MKMNIQKPRMHRAIALVLMATAALLGAGCHRHETGADHAPGAPKTAAGEEVKTASATHFSDRSELFVEYKPLIVGEETAFAAHMTKLSDFKPFTAGKLTATLSGGNQPEESFAVDAPTQPGIFRPVAKPRHAGERSLTFRLETPEFTAVHVLGKVLVYADKTAAIKAGAEEKPEPPGAIAYLKEQQWKTDYALTLVGKRALRESVSATGTLRAPANQEAQLNAITSGQIVAADEFPRIGMVVQKGQVLAYLVPRLGGETDVATLDLAAQKARLALQRAMHERERLEALFKQEAVAEKRVIDVRNDESVARAELTSAERRLGQYRNAGQASAGIALKAPIAGTVAEIQVAPGGFINEGQPIVRLVNVDKLWLEARIAESDIGRLAQPTGAALRIDGFEQAFEIDPRQGGRLVAFGNVIDPATRTTPLLFEFPNPDKRLRIGMAARVNVYSGKAVESIAIPAAAVIDDNGQPVVYVQRSGEAFERQPVQLGVRDGEWVEVKNGVSPGERIVSKGAYQVRLAATAPAAMGEGHVH